MACAFCLLENVELQEIVNLGGARVWTPAWPLTAGHLMVMPTRHVERYPDLERDDLLAVHEAISVARGLLIDGHGLDAMNLALNDGRAAGQSVPHVHVHLWGRTEGDDDTNPFPVLNGRRPTPSPPADLARLTARWRSYLP